MLFGTFVFRGRGLVRSHLCFRLWADLSEKIAASFHRESRVARRLQRKDLIQRMDGPADHSAVHPVLVNVARRRMTEIVAVHEQLDFLGPVRNSALNPNDDSLHGTSSLALDSQEVNAVTIHIGRWGVPQSWRRPNLMFGGIFRMTKTLYMVVEHFKNKDAVPVYRRLRDHGRLAPEGLLYVSSWVDDKLELCYQLMETHNRKLVDQWIANWSDLADFEVYPVMVSTEAAKRIAPRL